MSNPFEIPVGDEQDNNADTLFEVGDEVDVIANVDDSFSDFVGTVMRDLGEGIIQVRDRDDNVWCVGENQCEKVD
jgi:vesicle coat complex subunit